MKVRGRIEEEEKEESKLGMEEATKRWSVAWLVRRKQEKEFRPLQQTHTQTEQPIDDVDDHFLFPPLLRQTDF